MSNHEAEGRAARDRLRQGYGGPPKPRVKRAQAEAEVARKRRGGGAPRHSRLDGRWYLSLPAIFAITVVLTAQDRVVLATLTYGAPGNGPSVNFSPKGTQVALTDVAANETLPAGAVRPA